MEIEALYYTRLDDGVCRCDLCPRGCVIKPGKKGYCLSRENVDGRLMSALYGKVAAMQVDPIEKKPLYHFLPGTDLLSIGTIGCNLGCKFCQNWHLARGKSRTVDVTPEEVIEKAKREGGKSIAYTYNEPLVWYEFVTDCCRLAHASGLKNVFVTNGTLNPEPFDELLEQIDALNIDIKGDAKFYEEMSDSVLEPVKRNIQKAAQVTHVEVTTLLVTGKNDSDETITEIVDFIASVDPKIPLHFSRYFPNYKFDASPTDVEVMRRAFSIAREKLQFVYLGNVNTDKGRDTYCPSCMTPAVRRLGYSTQLVGVDLKGHCAACGFDLNIVSD